MALVRRGAQKGEVKVAPRKPVTDVVGQDTDQMTKRSRATTVTGRAILPGHVAIRTRELIPYVE